MEAASVRVLVEAQDEAWAAYRIEDSGVCIVAIAHARRRFGYWRDRQA